MKTNIERCVSELTEIVGVLLSKGKRLAYNNVISNI